MGDRDDLARTATAPASGTPPQTPADPVGSTLGRYKLERELGQGGMGVVHAAFDPNLERRVALKVLREAAGSQEARQRLLNEARAMARLQHPNVVTVHEVDSAGGRDYVAMELIEGQTLAEWMREAQRPEAEIIAAFVAAGRGLAAAHAEGIVHRDFKPHNILRHRTGRIAVTDFGLARDAEEPPTDPMAETRELRAATAGIPVSTSSSELTPSSPLGGLTETGSVLGTPAYMAPEQWSGKAVTHASDQFAFCVALWEALAGERPFKGPNLESLRDEVARGPAKLDFGKIPRRLRPALMRGLDPDPARRWSSMNALLAAMGTGEKASKFVYIVVGAAAVAVIAMVVVVRVLGTDSPATTPEPACRKPALVIDGVWPAGAAEKMRGGNQRSAAELLDADARKWKTERERACTVDVAKREPQLRCLDGVLARIDVVARGVEAIAGKRDVDIGPLLVDPAVCGKDPPPRLTSQPTPQLRAAIAGVLFELTRDGRPSQDSVQALLKQAQGDSCAGVYARYLAIKASESDDRQRIITEANEEAERCDDDRVRADMALLNADLAMESNILGATITSKVKLAELSAQRVAQPDVLAQLESMRAEIAARADQPEEAIKRAERAMQLYAERGRVAAELAMGLKIIGYRRSRATLEDLGSFTPTYDALKKRGIEKLGAENEAVRDIEQSATRWQYENGDVAGAYERGLALYRPEPNDPARRVTGRVVDAQGKPVANAKVGAGRRMGGNEFSAAVPVDNHVRYATTGPDGTFEIPDAVDFGAIVAESGDQRSEPTPITDNVTLRLAPTSTISGRVDLRGEPSQVVTVVAVDPSQPSLRYAWASPVGADGSFTISGVPRKKLKIIAAIDRSTVRQAGSADVTVRSPKVEKLSIDISKSKRLVHVIVRSTISVALGNAEVLIVAGKVPSMTARQLRQAMGGINEKAARQIEGERAPPPVVKLQRPGDLYATMNEVPDVATACAIALPQDLADPQLGKKIDANLDKLKIECLPIPDGAEAILIEVPPFPRLD